jgi:hypothetical protein
LKSKKHVKSSVLFVQREERVMAKRKTFKVTWKQTGETFEAWQQANGFGFQRIGETGPPWRHLPTEGFWKHFNRMDAHEVEKSGDEMLLFGGSTRG